MTKDVGDEVDLGLDGDLVAWPQLKASRGVVVNMASLNGSLSFKNLASDDSAYVTGIDLVVDGGMKVW